LRSGAIVSQCATEEGQRSKPAGALSPLFARNVLGKLVELRGGCDGTTTAKAQTNLKLAARFRIELAMPSACGLGEMPCGRAQEVRSMSPTTIGAALRWFEDPLKGAHRAPAS